MSPRSHSHLFDLALLAVAVIATGMVGLMYFKPNQPPAGVNSPVALARGLQGQSLAPLSVETEIGSEETWIFPDDGRVRLVLVFNSTCAYCEQSVPAWKRLSKILGTASELYLLNDQSAALAREWLTEHTISEESTLFIASPRDLAQWGVPGYPATILLQGNTVELAQFGAVTDADIPRWETAVSRVVPPAL